MRASVLLSAILLVCGCSNGSSGPVCRAANGLCTATTDCCNGLTCQGGMCKAAAQCRNNGDACAASADCCQGLICTANKCAPPPQCAGSGGNCATSNDCCNGLVCNANKCGMAQCQMSGNVCGSTNDCCNPLVCSGGRCSDVMCRGLGGACAQAADCCNPLVCNANTCSQIAQCRMQGDACFNTNDCCNPLVCVGGTCQPGQLSALTFVLDDQCFNGESIEFRFYDETDNLVWPDNQNVYLVSSGQQVQSTVACKLGNTICMGAYQPQHNLAWGVNIDNSLQCQSCCYICQNGQGPFTFTCQ
jgi:hypothetical protein